MASRQMPRPLPHEQDRFDQNHDPEHPPQHVDAFHHAGLAFRPVSLSL
jgi:hypothetical protein